MRKSIQRVGGMDLKNISKLSILLLGLLTGCTGGYALWGASDEVVYREDVVYDDAVSLGVASEVQEKSLLGSDNHFVNYR